MTTTIQALVSNTENLDPFANLFFSDAMDPGVMTFMPVEAESSYMVEAVSSLFDRLLSTVTSATDQFFTEEAKEEKTSKSLQKAAQTLENGFNETITGIPTDPEILQTVVKALDQVDEFNRDVKDAKDDPSSRSWTKLFS